MATTGPRACAGLIAARAPRGAPSHGPHTAGGWRGVSREAESRLPELGGVQASRQPDLGRQAWVRGHWGRGSWSGGSRCLARRG